MDFDGEEHSTKKKGKFLLQTKAARQQRDHKKKIIIQRSDEELACRIIQKFARSIIRKNKFLNETKQAWDTEFKSISDASQLFHAIGMMLIIPSFMQIMQDESKKNVFLSFL
eukprot:Rmarinus@m.29765